MPQFVWFDQPTNHSGTVNFLFLAPDGQVGHFTLDAPDGGGPYLLGGPALRDFRGEFTVTRVARFAAPLQRKREAPAGVLRN
jgi:hypothetical protein